MRDAGTGRARRVSSSSSIQLVGWTVCLGWRAGRSAVRYTDSFSGWRVRGYAWPSTPSVVLGCSPSVGPGQVRPSRRPRGCSTLLGYASTVGSGQALGLVHTYFLLLISLLCGFLRLLSPAFLRACHGLLFPTIGAAWVAGGWGTNLDVGRTSVTGSGRWEWLPPNLVAPEWSNRCNWSGSIYSESEIRIQLSIRLFSLCDPLRVALGTEQNLGRHCPGGGGGGRPPNL